MLSPVGHESFRHQLDYGAHFVAVRHARLFLQQDDSVLRTNYIQKFFIIYGPSSL